jgi:phosphatidylglycerol lysyltransferase
VRERTRALYDFEGVRAFKAKLRPRDWEAIHLAFPLGESANGALFDALHAFARGSFTRFGAQTLVQGPVIVVRALALSLVPWTVMAALASASRFPSPWAKGAWVVADAALAVALFALSLRWRAWLGRVVATAATLDAVVTWGEVMVWNAPRARTAGDWLAATVACLAPAIASVILWGAVKHRRWMRNRDSPLRG